MFWKAQKRYLTLNYSHCTDAWPIVDRFSDKLKDIFSLLPHLSARPLFQQSAWLVGHPKMPPIFNTIYAIVSDGVILLSESAHLMELLEWCRLLCFTIIRDNCSCVDATAPPTQRLIYFTAAVMSLHRRGALHTRACLPSKSSSTNSTQPLFVLLDHC